MKHSNLKTKKLSTDASDAEKAALLDALIDEIADHRDEYEKRIDGDLPGDMNPKSFGARDAQKRRATAWAECNDLLRFAREFSEENR